MLMIKRILYITKPLNSNTFTYIYIPPKIVASIIQLVKDVFERKLRPMPWAQRIYIEYIFSFFF